MAHEMANLRLFIRDGEVKVFAGDRDITSSLLAAGATLNLEPLPSGRPVLSVSMYVDEVDVDVETEADVA